ncbi:hypothetical protein GFD21_08400 [Bifidobacterium sp. SMA15]|uniref:DUF4190 domain-containing protein n=1 Tax=Bifidobacterium platyrrhinorum TaxID=2661628 RepID=A0A6L9STF7_9BIFI|nr:hypothetical protein [Bifidobacterium platyrrhinorum]
MPQPQYGQYAQPDYGAMRSQFGPNYDPYLYGAPDPDPKQDSGDGGADQADGVPQPMAGRTPGAAYPGGYPGAQGGPYGWNGANGAGAPGGPYAQGNRPDPGAGSDGHTPRYFYGIDVNDPNQNPLYGHWDSYAIIAFVFALVFSVPLLPAIMGGVSLWRTRTFHMKGRGLAVAAIVINVLTTALQIWMWVNGIDVTDLTNQMLNMVGGGTSGSSGSDSMSA